VFDSGGDDPNIRPSSSAQLHSQYIASADLYDLVPVGRVVSYLSENKQFLTAVTCEFFPDGQRISVEDAEDRVNAQISDFTGFAIAATTGTVTQRHSDAAGSATTIACHSGQKLLCRQSVRLLGR
jgi:hypothetical protein